MVNGTKVDPMRVRLPNSRMLAGEELVAFQRERERIDELQREEGSNPLRSRAADESSRAAAPLPAGQDGCVTQAMRAATRQSPRRQRRQWR